MSRDEEMTNKEALNIITDMCDAIQLHPNSRQGKAIMMAINSLKNGTPSVENKGEWKRTYLDHVAMGERPSILYCSICCQCIAYPTNFCPNCGADMRGET